MQDFELRDLELEPMHTGARNDNFARLRTSDFFKELMRKHGMTNPEYREYALGAKRYNLERQLLETQEDRINKGAFYMRYVAGERNWINKIGEG